MILTFILTEYADRMSPEDIQKHEFLLENFEKRLERIPQKKAEALAQKGDYLAANKHLFQAANLVEAALTRARDKETLVHQLKFETPEDEYAYELQRNNSNQLLIVVVKRKKPPQGTNIKYIEKLVAENDGEPRSHRA